MNRLLSLLVLSVVGKVIYLPKIPFSAHIRANPKMSIEPSCLHQLYESNQIVITLEIVLHQNKNVRIFLELQENE